MQEILNDTDDQEDHREGQTTDSQNAQEGQAGIGGIVKQRSHGRDRTLDPSADLVKNISNGGKHLHFSFHKF